MSAGNGLMTYAEIAATIATVWAFEDGAGDREQAEAAIERLRRNGLDGQGRDLR